MKKSNKNVKLNDEIKLLMEELQNIGPVMRGSVTIMGKKNKQPYFSVGIKGKTKLIYLGNKRAEIAKEYSENYKNLLNIVDKITLCNMKYLKSIKTKQ